MKYIKVRVENRSSYKASFEVVNSDQLPENGEYLLIPVGKESSFVTNYLQNLFSKFENVAMISYKLDDLQLRVNAILERLGSKE